MTDTNQTARMHAAIKQLDPDGGWDHETSGGWPSMETWYGLRDAAHEGYVEQSTAYDVECWRLTDEGITFLKEMS